MCALDTADRKIILARRRQVLLKLQLISDARAGRPMRKDVTVIKGGAGSSPPADVNLERIPDSATPPPKERSLFAFYVWQFARLDEEVKAAQGADVGRAWMRVDLMCSRAMRDYMLHRGDYRRPMSDTDTANAGRVLAEYPGVSAEEVAVWEMCDPKWVRKIRRDAGLDELGNERELSDRDERIHTLARRGLSQRAIAVQIGVNASTVNRVLAA